MGAQEIGARPAALSDTAIETAPRANETFNEKCTAVDIKEVSSTASPTPSLRIKRHEHSRKSRTPRKQMPMDRFFKACSRQSPFVKAFVLTLMSAIPFVVFLLVAKLAYPQGTSIDQQGTGVTMFQLAKWLIISWASFMGLLWCGRIFAAFSAWICSQSQYLVKYQRLAEALCLRVVLMLWAIVCFYVMPKVFHDSILQHDPKRKDTAKNWATQLHDAFKFLIVAFAIIVVQGVAFELSTILYLQGWMGPRSQRASDELETIKQLHDLVDPHTDDHLHLMGKMIRKLLLPIDENNLYYQISRGRGNSQIWTEYAHNLWTTIAQGRTSMTRFDIDQQLRAMNRDPDRGHDLFVQLDESCDGEVTFDEVEKLVHRVGLQLNARDQAQHGIKRLLFKLEVLLSLAMFWVIFLIWMYFWGKPETIKTITTFWTGVMGLAFAFQGVVTEFVKSCVFVFGRHPYDVGDYVELKGRKMIVQKIFLTHTNFEETADPTERGVVVQTSHDSLFGEPIVNWTRTHEAVIEKKAATSKHDEEEKEAKTEAENKATSDVRELVQLKVEQLKGIKSEEKY